MITLYNHHCVSFNWVVLLKPHQTVLFLSVGSDCGCFKMFTQYLFLSTLLNRVCSNLPEDCYDKIMYFRIFTESPF